MECITCKFYEMCNHDIVDNNCENYISNDTIIHICLNCIHHMFEYDGNSICRKKPRKVKKQNRITGSIVYEDFDKLNSGVMFEKCKNIRNNDLCPEYENKNE